MAQNEIIAEYKAKLLDRKQSEKFFTKEEVILLKKMEMFNDDGRNELAHKFQDFINENYKKVTVSEIVAEVYFNEGIKDFAEIAEKLNFHGRNEKIYIVTLII